MDCKENELDLADSILFSIGLFLVLAGFVIGILALVVAIVRSVGDAGKTKSGGLIVIGPVPIVFGTDEQSVRRLMFLGIALMTFFLVLSLIILLWR